VTTASSSEAATRFTIANPLSKDAFRSALRSAGVNPIKLASRSPNLHVHAGRFVQTVKLECVSQVIPLDERHLRRAVKEYVEHSHLEHNRDGLGKRLVDRGIDRIDRCGLVKCHQRLGQLLRYNDRAA
jgi:hypothetical protein